jgi:hypothetical protein
LDGIRALPRNASAAVDVPQAAIRLSRPQRTAFKEIGGPFQGGDLDLINLMQLNVKPEQGRIQPST